jgi:CheY-like chemotaxis protein
MKILIVDREEVTAQLMAGRLEPLGHKIVHEPNKNTAVELAGTEKFDLIFIDPAPLTSARPVILNLRHKGGKYTYIVQLGQSITQLEAIKCGANDALNKPINPEQLDQVVHNARALVKQVMRISDNSTDFPSAGGIISKSAFNQLFLSAIDRADRYGERSYVVFIGVKNHQTITEGEGPYEADILSAKLSQYLVRLRRQSDIIAQTENCEYALLLQRPMYETEPKEAANRFAESIGGYAALFDKNGIKPEFYVQLVDLPIGSQIIEHTLTKV